MPEAFQFADYLPVSNFLDKAVLAPPTLRSFTAGTVDHTLTVLPDTGGPTRTGPVNCILASVDSDSAKHSTSDVGIGQTACRCPATWEWAASRETSRCAASA